MTLHHRPTRNRREFLTDAFCGFGALAFGAMMAKEEARAQSGRVQSNPLAAKPPHHTARAKSVIFLFLSGGPSQMESFDPKPLLNKLHGQKRPASFGEGKYQFLSPDAKLLGTKRTFKRYGKNGIEVSDLFPHIAERIDDIAVIRSCQADMVVHSAAQYQLFTGRVVPGFPSMGSWAVYGLGSEAESLPSYVVLPDPHGGQEGGAPMFSNGFLPAVYQPTHFRPGDRPVLNLDLPEGVRLDDRRRTLGLIRQLNQLGMRPDDTELAARINSYDLAFRMQTEAPAIFDLSNEPRETLELYGIGRKETDDYGRRCLLARRLIERGVRFVCPVSGGGSGNLQWDAHDDIEENHLRMAAQTDQPIAALLTDLKRRGLLDETLVLIGGEFGRSPESQGARGRDHHNLAFTMLLAGGGVRGGQTYGTTDEIGMRVVENPVHLRDLHATMLHQLGLDQNLLTYLHLGREERLTEVQGNIVTGLI